LPSNVLQHYLCPDRGPDCHPNRDPVGNPDRSADYPETDHVTEFHTIGCPDACSEQQPDGLRR